MNISEMIVYYSHDNSFYKFKFSNDGIYLYKDDIKYAIWIEARDKYDICNFENMLKSFIARHIS